MAYRGTVKCTVTVILVTASGLAVGALAAVGLVATTQQLGSDDVFYHRLESTKQSPDVAAQQQASGQIWGLTPQGGMAPTVQAYNGPLPTGARGVEFTTPVAPEPGSGVPLPGGPVRWYGGITPGVTVNPEGYAVLPATITRNTQVSP